MDEIKAVVETAGQAGRFVTAHSHNPIASKNAILSGVKSIDHAHGTNDEVVALAIEHNVIFVSSLAAIKLVLDHIDDIPPWLEQRAKREWDVTIEGYRRMYKAGAILATGSDFNGSAMAPLGDNAVELELITKYCGFSAMDAIISATRNGSLACFAEDKIGTLEPGKFADILLIDGDPLADIAILQDMEKIKMVMLEGKIEVDRGILISRT